MSVKSCLSAALNMEMAVGQISQREHLQERFTDHGGVNFLATAEELEKFFLLTRTCDAPLAMINPNVDLLWHSFIEFTEDYEGYCKQEFGEFVHHRPRSASTPVPTEAISNFVQQYEACFGPLPDIWLRGTPVEILDFAQKRTNTLSGSIKWSGWPGRSAK